MRTNAEDADRANAGRISGGLSRADGEHIDEARSAHAMEYHYEQGGGVTYISVTLSN